MNIDWNTVRSRRGRGRYEPDRKPVLTVERDSRRNAWMIFDDWSPPDEVGDLRHDWNVFGDLVLAYQTVVDSLYEESGWPPLMSLPSR